MSETSLSYAAGIGYAALQQLGDQLGGQLRVVLLEHGVHRGGWGLQELLRQVGIGEHQTGSQQQKPSQLMHLTWL